MNLNKNFLTEVIKYLISKGVTLTDVLDTFNERFNALNAFSDSLKNVPTEIKHGTINNVIEEPLLPKYTLTESDKISLESVSLSPEALNKVFDTSKENPLPCRKLKSKSGQMLFDVINGKTVIEHLKENGISYTNFDNRIRKKWSIEKACTTPLTKVVKPYTRAKKSEEPKAVIIPDTNVKCLEPEKITGTKKRMMLVNGVMTEIEVSDTDLVQSDIETGTKVTTVIIDNVIPAENTAESVTIEPQTKTDTDTRVNDTNANSDVKNSESERIEQLTDKTVRDIVTGKNKEKKKAEPKRDYTASDLCLKLGLTTHELREKIEMGEIPQPDCGNKWSAKLLKDKDIILLF